MLALTRRIGEEIVIGDPANPVGVIRVVAVHGDKVRLSFDFPKDVKINRRELAEMKLKGIGPGDHPPSQQAAPPSGSPPDNGGRPA